MDLVLAGGLVPAPNMVSATLGSINASSIITSSRSRDIFPNKLLNILALNSAAPKVLDIIPILIDLARVSAMANTLGFANLMSDDVLLPLTGG